MSSLADLNSASSRHESNTLTSRLFSLVSEQKFVNSIVEIPFGLGEFSRLSCLCEPRSNLKHENETSFGLLWAERNFIFVPNVFFNAAVLDDVEKITLSPH